MVQISAGACTCGQLYSLVTVQGVRSSVSCPGPTHGPPPALLLLLHWSELFKLLILPPPPPYVPTQHLYTHQQPPVMPGLAAGGTNSFASNNIYTHLLNDINNIYNIYTLSII